VGGKAGKDSGFLIGFAIFIVGWQLGVFKKHGNKKRRNQFGDKLREKLDPEVKGVEQGRLNKNSKRDYEGDRETTSVNIYYHGQGVILGRGVKEAIKVVGIAR